MHGAAVVSAVHGNMGSQHSSRLCRTLLPCTAPNLCNSRKGHSSPCCRRASTMDKNMPIARCQVAFRPASRWLRQKARWSACASYLSPCRCFLLPLILSVLPGGRNERAGSRPLRGDACKPVRGIERDFDARTTGWISGQNLDRIGSPYLLAMLKSCPPR